MDNPHLKFKSIHVAGTNGKGSVCAMLASICVESGYKTGLYTSPHLIKYNERIKIGNREIGDRELEKYFELVKPYAKKVSATIFEILTAIAFRYFSDKNVDIAVVEVGMGGRFDATNVLTSEISVITNIDYDHTEYLGKTLSKIAFEKGGIIKPQVLSITAEKKLEALCIIRKICKDRGSKLIEVGSGGRDRKLVKMFDVEGGLIGKYQRLNKAIAIKAAEKMGISKSAIKQGLKKTQWPARFQIIRKNPLIILDGAHNLAGVRVLKVTIKEQEIKGPIVLIFGAQKDKDVDHMIKELAPLAETVIITQSSHPQAMPVYELEKKFKKESYGIIVTSNVSLALKEAHEIKGMKTILICGSLYLAGDILRSLTKAA